MNDTPRLSDKERALWRAHVRDVTPCCGQERVSVANNPLSFGSPPAVPCIQQGKHAPSPPSPTKPMFLTRKAQRAIQFTAKCDLHGYTASAAFNVVQQFLVQACAQKHRVVLVVTGKGLNSSGTRETLRELFPCWMQEPQVKQCVRGFSQASRRHGGEGAFYLFLRIT
ncbi:MAG: Smr/MutS family protein [Holosporales bacterium]|nr:Smr/MutS family protein [Holosporales bacterium]